jgi:replicative DNA helicase Mcm
MEVLISLEGEQKSPVLEQTFIEELVKSEKFNEAEAKNYIRKMIREASIYESKPGYYNTV